MKRYIVKIVETVETVYEVEIEAESKEEAELGAEDILVNHEDAAKACIQSEKQVSITRHASEL